MSEHDIITLKKDFNSIKRGTQGTILFVSKSSKYVTVEFFDKNHNTISIETLLKTLL